VLPGEPAPARHSAEVHARALIDWVRASEWAGPLLYEDILEMYLNMCVEKFWEVRHWNPVAAHFTRLTTGRKVYAWIHRDGVPHRLRVYPIPTLPPAPGQPKARNRNSTKRRPRAAAPLQKAA
jgi:hypothetical protein